MLKLISRKYEDIEENTPDFSLSYYLSNREDIWSHSKNISKNNIEKNIEKIFPKDILFSHSISIYNLIEFDKEEFYNIFSEDENDDFENIDFNFENTDSDFEDEKSNLQNKDSEDENEKFNFEDNDSNSQNSNSDFLNGNSEFGDEDLGFEEIIINEDLSRNGNRKKIKRKQFSKYLNLK